MQLCCVGLQYFWIWVISGIALSCPWSQQYLHILVILCHLWWDLLEDFIVVKNIHNIPQDAQFYIWNVINIQLCWYLLQFEILNSYRHLQNTSIWNMVSNALQSVQSTSDYIHHANSEYFHHINLADVNNYKSVQLVNLDCSFAGKFHGVMCVRGRLAAWYSILSDQFSTSRMVFWQL